MLHGNAGATPSARTDSGAANTAFTDTSKSRSVPQSGDVNTLALDFHELQTIHDCLREDLDSKGFEVLSDGHTYATVVVSSLARAVPMLKQAYDSVVSSKDRAALVCIMF